MIATTLSVNILADVLQIGKSARVTGFRLFGELLQFEDTLLLGVQLILADLFRLEVGLRFTDAASEAVFELRDLNVK